MKAAATADKQRLAGNAGRLQNLGRQRDAAFRIERQAVRALQDHGQVVLFVGEHGQVLETVRKTSHEVLAAGFAGVEFEKRIDVDAVERLTLEGVAEGLGHRDPPFFVDPVGVPADKECHSFPRRNSFASTASTVAAHP